MRIVAVIRLQSHPLLRSLKSSVVADQVPECSLEHKISCNSPEPLSSIDSRVMRVKESVPIFQSPELFPYDASKHRTNRASFYVSLRDPSEVEINIVHLPVDPLELEPDLLILLTRSLVP